MTGSEGGRVVVVLLVGRSAAGDGACAEERERLNAVLRALVEHEQTAAARATAADWEVVVRETCTWARGRATKDTDCVGLHTCARLHADDRLAWVAPGWDTATFARVTGDPACTPESGPSCAVAAADAADLRLRTLMETLQVRGDSPDVAQVAWSRYRDAACREDALAAPDLRAWTSAACRAVLTIRRADLLTRLAQDFPH
jgi:hypothetical protein